MHTHIHAHTHTHIHTQTHTHTNTHTHLDKVLNPAMGVPLYLRLYPDQRLDMRVESIRHELKLPIGRNKGDGAIILEA